MYHITLVFMNWLRRVNPRMFLNVDSLCAVECCDSLIELIEIRKIKIVTGIESPNCVLDMAVKPFVVRIEKGNIVRIRANVIQAGIPRGKTALVLLLDDDNAVRMPRQQVRQLTPRRYGRLVIHDD